MFCKKKNTITVTKKTVSIDERINVKKAHLAVLLTGGKTAKIVLFGHAYRYKDTITVVEPSALTFVMELDYTNKKSWNIGSASHPHFVFDTPVSVKVVRYEDYFVDSCKTKTIYVLEDGTELELVKKDEK